MVKQKSVPKMSSDERLSVMCILICSFLIGYGIGSSTVIVAPKHPSIVDVRDIDWLSYWELFF
jgi:hypothetical protein